MARNLEKYTDALVATIDRMQVKAIEKNQEVATPEHFLFGLLENRAIISILESMKVDIDKLTLKTVEAINKYPSSKEEDYNYDCSISQEMAKLLNVMEKIAQKREEDFITVEIAFLALYKIKNTELILNHFDIKESEFETQIKRIRKGKKPDSKKAEENRDYINKFTVDLTGLAAEGKLDPIIGRDEEVRRAIQVLLRRSKNNPVLIGESGVGKTAVAEALAQRIVNDEVPEGLADKTILSLDMGMLIAGASLQGEFEERLKGLIREVVDTDGEAILFIDEMHLLVGAGKSQGAMDAANLLKPELARGNMHVVGATTLDEYKQYIEKDSALERRFQKVLIEEPSVEDTISILRGIKEKYEVHHGVDITDDALLAAARLSDRYVTDRNLPDKAIDLMDEAASVIRMEIESKPEAMDMLHRKIIQKKIELTALAKEEDKKAKVRHRELERSINKMEQEYSSLEEVWLAEKAAVIGESDLREELDTLKNEMKQCQRAGNLERVAEIQYKEIPELEKRLQETKEQEKELEIVNELLRNRVTDKEIAEVISKWTGIPVNKMGKEESEKLMNLENDISSRVIGQEKAIKNVSSCIRRSRAGLANPNRPIGSFLFLGPTGVGKTEMTKATSQVLFEDEDQVVRIDMSEYMEKHSVARLVGAPPGYVGYEEGGVLTEAVRRKPYSVVLLDEVEKADPDVFNILLQVLDHGRLTDSQGRVVNFKNTLIIMTSNIGAATIQESIANEEAYEDIQDKVTTELEDFMRPEFINRIDDVIVFHPLTKENVTEIAGLRLNGLNKLLKSKGMTLEVQKPAMKKLVEKGYDPKFGARPLNRAVQRYLENPLSDAIIKGDFMEGDTIKAYVKEGEIRFKK